MKKIKSDNSCRRAIKLIHKTLEEMIGLMDLLRDIDCKEVFLPKAYFERWQKQFDKIKDVQNYSKSKYGQLIYKEEEITKIAKAFKLDY